ncbi:MAG TPA: carbon storage regulator CsrA [Phycisphaerales bacterium]|nr:carbon storage regulator CsrA [Phycisphaerales bacterium]
MLVLSRQRDETIMIGDDIEITVVDIRGDKVRLGITAPTRIAVHRKEVYEAIRRENQQAATIAGELGAIRPGVRPGVKPKTASLTSGHAPIPIDHHQPPPARAAGEGVRNSQVRGA